MAGEWQACSRTCGDGGIAQRHLYCVREFSDLSLQPVDHRLCLTVERPDSERPCAADVDCPTWVTGQWSHVSLVGLRLMTSVGTGHHYINKCKKLKQFKTRCKDDMVNSDN